MLDPFLDALEAPLPSPAGASAGAAAAAMAASLVTLAARVSDGWAGARDALTLAGALRRRLVSLAEDDVRVLSEAMQTAPGTRAAGTFASDVPLEIARAAAEAVELAALTAERCKPSVRADAVTAAVLAEAGCRAAARIVAANLTAAPDDPRTALAEQARARARAALERVRDTPAAPG